MVDIRLNSRAKFRDAETRMNVVDPSIFRSEQSIATTPRVSSPIHDVRHPYPHLSLSSQTSSTKTIPTISIEVTRIRDVDVEDRGSSEKVSYAKSVYCALNHPFAQDSVCGSGE